MTNRKLRRILNENTLEIKQKAGQTAQVPTHRPGRWHQWLKTAACAALALICVAGTVAAIRFVGAPGQGSGNEDLPLVLQPGADTVAAITTKATATTTTATTTATTTSTAVTTANGVNSDTASDDTKFRVNILMETCPLFDEFPEQFVGDLVNDTLFESNLQAQWTANVTLNYFVKDPIRQADAATVKNILSAITMAGETLDMVVTCSAGTAAYLTTRGLLMDLSSQDCLTPYRDLLFLDMNPAGPLYFAPGLSPNSLAYAPLMLFNKNTDSYLTAQLYTTAESERGDWTLDALCQAAAEASRDLDGDNFITPEHDVFGLVTTKSQLTLILETANATDSHPALQKAQSRGFIADLTAICQDAPTGASAQKQQEIHLMLNGKCFFALATFADLVGNLGQSIDALDTVGILPLPTAEGAKSYTAPLSDAYVYAISATSGDAAVDFLAAKADSMQDAMPAIRQLLLMKYASTDKDANMLDMILGSLSAKGLK